MRYAFPNDLAEQVIARWQTFVARHDRPAPPLPSPECLRYILETAFFASFAREEDRELRFVLCCVPALTVPRDGGGKVPVMRFQSARPLSIQSLRSVAPAVSAQNAALLVRVGADVDDPSGCELAGVLNVGSHLSRSRSGRSFYNRPSPYALIIDVRDAGEMHIYRGGIKLATLKSGQLHDQLAYSGLEFLPISDILARGHEALRARIRPPDIEPARESADFEWTALLVAPGSERSLPVRMKFDVDERESVVADRFVDFVNARHQLAGAQARTHQSGTAARSGSFSHLKNATFVAEEDLADAADVTARLSAVDGALVVRSDLAVLGFGAEIVSDATQPLNALEVTGHPLRGSDWPTVDVESFGMRHRSALRCIAAADGAAAFVVSQDGTVTFVWKQDGRLLLKRNVNTSNPNMVGA